MALTGQTEQINIYKHAHSLWAQKFYSELRMQRVSYGINFIIFGLPKLQILNTQAKKRKWFVADVRFQISNTSALSDSFEKHY